MSQVRTPDAATVPLPLRSVLPAFGLDVGIAMALCISSSVIVYVLLRRFGVGR